LFTDRTFRGIFGLPLPPSLIGVDLPAGRDDAPILDLAWPTPTRVFLLTEESVEIMDLCGCFPTFLTAPGAAELVLVTVSKIAHNGIVRFIPNCDFLFAASDQKLFCVVGERELKPLAATGDCVAVGRGGDTLVASEGCIFRCTDMPPPGELQRLAEALRKRAERLQERRRRLAERQRALDERIARLERAVGLVQSDAKEAPKGWSSGGDLA
jgi:hypothetical protein